MDTKKMRACSSLLPDPGGEVVRECLDEIERLREKVNYLADGMRDVFPAAHTLAHVLECLLMDTKDMATVSKWWDSAQEAIEQWREFCREDDKKTMNCDRSACGDFSPGRCDNPDCPALVTPNAQVRGCPPHEPEKE